MKSYIGLNEVALGIHVPKFWGELMRRTASRASGAAIDRVLLDATLMPSEQALDMGPVYDHMEDVDALGWEALADEGTVEMLRGVVARLGLKGPKSNL